MDITLAELTDGKDAVMVAGAWGSRAPFAQDCSWVYWEQLRPTMGSHGNEQKELK